MFGLGALIKAITRPIDARKQIAKLDAAISALEHEANASVLDTLSGVERFECAARLADATFLLHISEAGSRERRESLIRQYLERLDREYERARMDLVQQPATRAEVVAISLALKELALTLDDEVESARVQHSQLIQQLHERIANTEEALIAAVLARTQPELDTHASELKKVRIGLTVLRADHDQSVALLRKSMETVETRVMEEFGAVQVAQAQQHNETSARVDTLHRSFEDHQQESERRFVGFGRRLDVTVRENALAIASLRSEHKAGLVRLEKQQVEHREELLKVVTDLRTHQDGLREVVTRSVNRINNWLMLFGAAILILALFLGLQLQG